jgi:6-carboxyhexanoate--CoA ligase
MTVQRLYSIRMRASAAQAHISGAERLVTADRIAITTQELAARALGKGTPPDEVVITLDALGDAAVRSLRALDLTAVAACDVAECRQDAARVLAAAGVSPQACEEVFRHLEQGAAASGGNMRGAMIMNAGTGERLEPDRDRGVRVSRFDWSDEASAAATRELDRLGLTHFRTKEALALATKVAHAPGLVAELCWSDDPDYTAGYVSSLLTGYNRFPHMKQTGSGFGGRAFFVRSAGLDLAALLTYLQQEPVLISGIGAFSQAG